MITMKSIISLITFSIFSLPLYGYTGLETPLMMAAASGDLNQMKQLIAQGAKVNEETEWDFLRPGEPALAFAIRGKHYDAVTALIEAGANVNRYVWAMSTEILPLELSIRAPTILGYAVAIHAPLNVIKQLISAGADVNLRGLCTGNVTPLIIAAYIGYEEAVQVLLEAGADTSQKHEGKTAYDFFNS